MVCVLQSEIRIKKRWKSEGRFAPALLTPQYFFSDQAFALSAHPDPFGPDSTAAPARARKQVTDEATLHAAVGVLLDA